MENINTNFEDELERQHILQKYTRVFTQLRTLAINKYGLHANYFDQYIQLQYLDGNDDSYSSNYKFLARSNLTYLKNEVLSNLLERRKQIFICINILLIALYICVCQKELLLEHNTAAMTYKGIRLWRRLTLPIIRHFPQLTELYDESCLMENPFFQRLDLSCDDCAQVQSVLDLTDLTPTQFPVDNSPYILKIEQRPVQLNEIHDLYVLHQNIFQQDAFRISSSNVAITNLDELFHSYNNSENKVQHEAHSLWRCNRMHPARLLRPLFTRPILLTNTALALERFLSIDTAQALSYILPETKCTNVYVQQVLGTRIIILRPTSECRHQCRSLSVRLPQSHMLGYNKVYWKPISAPDPVADTFSISLIGSYC